MFTPQENTKLPLSEIASESGLSSISWPRIIPLIFAMTVALTSKLYATAPVKNCTYLELLDNAKRLGVHIPSNANVKMLSKVADAAVLASEPGPENSVFHFNKKSKWFNEFEEWTITFEYKEYKIDLTAEAIPLGKTLILEDLSIEFPRLKGELLTERLDAGSSEVLGAMKTIRSLAKEAGFSYLVISAERVTGARESNDRADSKVLMPFKLN